jgi:hypothetical protein
MSQKENGMLICIYHMSAHQILTAYKKVTRGKIILMVRDLTVKFGCNVF